MRTWMILATIGTVLLIAAGLTADLTTLLVTSTYLGSIGGISFVAAAFSATFDT